MDGIKKRVDIFLEIRLTHRRLSSNAWYLILRSYQVVELGSNGGKLSGVKYHVSIM